MRIFEMCEWNLCCFMVYHTCQRRRVCVINLLTCYTTVYIHPKVTPLVRTKILQKYLKNIF